MVFHKITSTAHLFCTSLGCCSSNNKNKAFTAKLKSLHYLLTFKGQVVASSYITVKSECCRTLQPLLLLFFFSFFEYCCIKGGRTVFSLQPVIWQFIFLNLKASVYCSGILVTEMFSSYCVFLLVSHQPEDCCVNQRLHPVLVDSIFFFSHLNHISIFRHCLYCWF